MGLSSRLSCSSLNILEASGSIPRAPLDDDNSVSTSPKIDLMILSIHGLICEPNTINQCQELPVVRAIVSFAGSPQNMQVSSSSICWKTGNLIVESNPLELEKNYIEKATKSSYSHSMFAGFGEDPEVESKRTASTKSSSSSSSRPHLRLDCSSESLDAASISLEEANRESEIMPDGRLLVESNAGIEVGEDGSVCVSEYAMEESLEWNANSSHRPDVILLNIALRTESGEIFKEGTAHVVLFGMREDDGITTMDLRLKDKTPSNPNTVPKNAEQPMFSLASDACIRVQLKTNVDSTWGQKDSSVDSKKGMEVGSLVEKTKKQEARTAKEVETAKPTSRSTVPPEPVQRSFFCGAMEFSETMRDMYNSFLWDNPQDYEEIIKAEPTFESTIDTRESLQI